MARTRATIMDIARELGLSKTTVSSALGGSGRISEEKRALIRETADRLGYVANRAARSLRVSRVGTIGLYIPPIARSLAFYMDFAFGVTEGAAAADYDVTLFARGLTPQRAFHVDGVIAIDPSPANPWSQPCSMTASPPSRSAATPARAKSGSLAPSRPITPNFRPRSWTTCSAAAGHARRCSPSTTPFPPPGQWTP